MLEPKILSPREPVRWSQPLGAFAFYRRKKKLRKCHFPKRPKIMSDRTEIGLQIWVDTRLLTQARLPGSLGLFCYNFHFCSLWLPLWDKSMRLDQSSQTRDTGWAPQKTVESWGQWWVPAGSLVPTHPWLVWEDSHMGMPLTWGQLLRQHGLGCSSLATLIWNSFSIFKPESAPCPFLSKGQWIQRWVTRWVGALC